MPIAVNTILTVVFAAFVTQLFGAFCVLIQNDHRRTAGDICQCAWRQLVFARRLVSLHLSEQSQEGGLTSWIVMN
ncbi:hypothetical protein LSAT2_017498 [Lamellibrachia satsuma]|nr:hypothetical protein LSAT2_017498 [Lamellibrachia satsuma]